MRLGVFAMMGGVAGVMRELLLAQHRALAQRNQTSALTGLPNQAALRRDLDGLIPGLKGQDAQDEKGILLLQIGLAEFRSLSTLFGHQLVQRYLQDVAGDIAGASAGATAGTAAGTAEKGLPTPKPLYHLYADSFAMVVDARLAKDIREVCGRLASAVARPRPIAGVPVTTTAHIGIARYPGHGEDGESLSLAARFAMEQAEERGTPYLVYDGHLHERRRAMLARLTELKAAIADDDLDLHFQPKLHLESGCWTGVEALVRWPREGGSILMPGQFVPAAERTDLIHYLSEWVIGSAMSTLESWQAQGIPLGIAFNLSARDLQNDRVIDQLRDLMALYEIAPERLEVEVTETGIIRDVARAGSFLQQLRDMGLRVAIDDFGTGQSGLCQLRDLPVDSLKIDQTFVGKMLTSPKDDMIVRSAIDLGHTMGLEVTAEGVETGAMLDHLHHLGCDHAQGYGIARPMTGADLCRHYPQPVS